MPLMGIFQVESSDCFLSFCNNNRRRCLINFMLEDAYLAELFSMLYNVTPVAELAKRVAVGQGAEASQRQPRC